MYFGQAKIEEDWQGTVTSPDYSRLYYLTSGLKSISAESQAAPVRLEVSVPESISTKNKVVQRIGFKLYPTYVMQNVLFQRVSGESVTANPSGVLSVKGTGTAKFYVIPPQNTEVWKEVDVTVRQPLIRLTSSGKMRLGSKIRIV